MQDSQLHDHGEMPEDTGQRFKLIIRTDAGTFMEVAQWKTDCWENPREWSLENGLDKNPRSSLDMCPQVVQLDSTLKYLPLVLAETMGSFQMAELAEFHNGVFLEKRCTTFWQKRAELISSLFCAHTYLWGLGRSNAEREMVGTLKSDGTVKGLSGTQSLSYCRVTESLRLEKKPLRSSSTTVNICWTSAFPGLWLDFNGVFFYPVFFFFNLQYCGYHKLFLIHPGWNTFTLLVPLFGNTQETHLSALFLGEPRRVQKLSFHYWFKQLITYLSHLWLLFILLRIISILSITQVNLFGEFIQNPFLRARNSESEQAAVFFVKWKYFVLLFVEKQSNEKIVQIRNSGSIHSHHTLVCRSTCQT